MKPSDYDFATYLKKKNHRSQDSLNLEELREEYEKTPQFWLDQNYPNKETKSIEEVQSIYINQQLEGVLDCREYEDLRLIFISSSVDNSKFEIKKGSGFFTTKIIPCIPAQT